MAEIDILPTPAPEPASKPGPAAPAEDTPTPRRKRPIRLLTVTTLFPNREMPAHGVFVENRLRKMIETGEVVSHVVAPVPWFPLGSRWFGRYGTYARVPAVEERDGLTVAHPRHLLVPKIGMRLTPYFLYRALKRYVERLIADGVEFDMIDAHYFYPDGVAAAWLARHIGVPVVITARGTDLNLIADYPAPRRSIERAIRASAGVIAVCEALMERARAIVPDGFTGRVLRNGVDLSVFRQLDRDAVRAELGVSGTTLLSVGLLVPRKGHELVIEAVSRLENVSLLVCGDGPMRAELSALIERLGVGDRVHLIGLVPHNELIRYYNAADALVLASSREGWPNVLLEAMACGTPVVATNVWGIPEVITAPEAGRVLPARTIEAMVETLRAFLPDLPPRDATRAYAENFSWDDTTRGQIEFFGAVIDQHARLPDTPAPDDSDTTPPIRSLVFSSLYPNPAQPRHGIFLEHRTRNLVKHGGVDTKVVAPVPLFPLPFKLFGRYGVYARVPRADRRYGTQILHPRYLLIPKIGGTLTPFLYVASLWFALRRLIKSGFDFDVIDAYYFYPDGVAAAILGRLINKPVAITAFGSDVNLILGSFIVPRALIRWAASYASGMSSVCEALREEMVAHGLEADKIRVILHGVDLNMFAPPVDRLALRAELGMARPTLLSVGELIPRKGHHLAIEAMRRLPDFDLVIVGDGAWENRFKAMAREFGVADRVRFLGHVDQGQLPGYYGAADALILASSREGIANVLMEAMACGTPVVATDIWGTPEVINTPAAGVLVSERTPDALADGVQRLFADYPDHAATRRHVEQYTWEETARQHRDMLRDIVAADRAHKADGAARSK